MNQPPSWDPYGQQDPYQYQGVPAYQGQPYQGQPAYHGQGQPAYQGRSYQGQQYQDEPPYQGPPRYEPSRDQQPYSGPGDGHDLRPTRHRKRRWGRGAIIGAAVAVAGIIVAAAIWAVGNGSHPTTAGQAGGLPTASPAHLARTGSILVLAGHSAGEKMTVTLVKAFRRPQPASRTAAPRQGYRLYAVQFQLDNTGSVAYSVSPSRGAVAVDSTGQSYQPSRDDVTECQSFPQTDHIAVGSSRLGCIVFQVPATARISEVWFTLGSGIGAQSARWQVGG